MVFSTEEEDSFACIPATQQGEHGYMFSVRAHDVSTMRIIAVVFKFCVLYYFTL